MNDKYADIKAMSAADRQEVLDYALERSREILQSDEGEERMDFIRTYHDYMTKYDAARELADEYKGKAKEHRFKAQSALTKGLLQELKLELNKVCIVYKEDGDSIAGVLKAVEEHWDMESEGVITFGLIVQSQGVATTKAFTKLYLGSAEIAYCSPVIDIAMVPPSD